MTAVVALLAGLTAWLLVDRPLPPERLVTLGSAASGALRDHLVRPSVEGPPLERAETPTRRRRVQSGHCADDLAATIDLLAVAVSAGHSLLGAVRVAGAEGSGPVADALGQVAAEFDRGVPLADGLAGLPRTLGPTAATLATTLSVAAVSGTPLSPALQRLAAAERRRARRSAEAQARRLPVLLLGPLVGLVLPAFVVLTIVPAALSSLAGRPHLESPLPPSNAPVATVAPGP